MVYTKAILLISVLLVSATASADQELAQQEIRELLNDFLSGASVNDAEMHDRFWSDDLIYTSSSGRRFGKAEIMAGLSESEEALENSPVYSAEEVDVRVLDHVAVVTFRLVATGAEGRIEGQYFNTGVLQRTDDQWKAIAWQATVIPAVSEEL
jgi:ketosteroid isomerase-like protein